MCANINLFMEINEEEFEKYLQTFVTDIWHMLMQVRGEAVYSRNYSLFEQQTILHSMQCVHTCCQSVWHCTVCRLCSALSACFFAVMPWGWR